ncbi:hypothetical protein FA15DRAFT_753398 [Coprinopsis marcescibilis]|uniref:F-box domain-containing protein n=1 Tax=Coprinopsis marcescibilis TaxID=230819 RepID=A0A5C3L7F9_COPMA|nr:hypothetical protein FA15DRAFT_753398 [Coprinopsis marcescibilis]
MDHPVLPPEILDLAIGDLTNDRATLLMASLTCRRFRHTCQKMLFTTYRLSEHNLGRDPLSPPERLLKTFETFPHLASCIQTLVVCDGSDLYPDYDNSEIQKRLFDACRRPLPLIYAQIKTPKRLEINAPGSSRQWSAIPVHFSLRSKGRPRHPAFVVVHVPQTAGALPAVGVLHSQPEIPIREWRPPDLPQSCQASSTGRLADTTPPPDFNNPKKLDLESMEELTFYRDGEEATRPGFPIIIFVDFRKTPQLRFLRIRIGFSTAVDDPEQRMDSFVKWLKNVKSCPNLKVLTVRLVLDNGPNSLFPRIATLLEELFLELDIETTNLVLCSHFVLETSKTYFSRLKPESFNLTHAVHHARPYPSYYNYNY